ncbi:MAG: VCBS repeat-containing protein, partial [Chitinophagaceae bacterium]|nr:VCBS repeat-containing protein [Chitinophagaceae bacterium]
MLKSKIDYIKKYLPIPVVLIAMLCSQCNNKKVMFETLSSSKTNISFTNQLPERENFNILYYIYYYNGGGVATGDINNDGLADIYFTANSKSGNKLYLNKGDFEFEDITDKAAVAGVSDWSSGVTMADINGDGYLDIYVSAVSNVHGLQGHNQLYINNGDLTFTESAALYGLDFAGFSTQAVFFDYDRDGDLDCYLLNHSERPHANIVDTSNRQKYDAKSGDRLYRNDMNTASKKFTDVSKEAGIYQSSLGYGLGLGVADINNDGWDDIYVGNDFHENDYYYLNNGNGTFSETGAKVFGHYSRFSMGNDIADYNNDGQLDIITVDMLPGDEKILKTYGSDENPDIYQLKLTDNGYQHQYSKNCLQRNNGNGQSFSEIALLSGVSATDWSWAPLFADLDNDGNKDLFVSSGILKRPVDLDFIKFVSSLESQKRMTGDNNLDDVALEKMPDGSSYPFLFKGDGNLQFTDVSHDWGTSKMKGYYTGAAYADLNNDGNLDLVISAINAQAVILKNNAPAKNNISISFKGNGMNSFGIGAKAYLFTKSGLQYQQLMLTRGFQSSSDARLHFGLDSLANIDSILVVWPNQKYQVLKNIPANKPLIAKEKDASGIFEYVSFFPAEQALFKDITEQVNFPWKHQENEFDDFNFQYLIPHAQSTRGPKTAIADVNGDGLDDIFTCGAKGQAGVLFIQQKNATFLQADYKLFNADSIAEDVDAIFFDANGDQHPDLYVVSGGNEYSGNHPALVDRLYMNDGKGNFTKS